MVRMTQTGIQQAPVVGHGVRPPGSDSDDSEDDVLSIGPMRLVVTAAPLGGARGQEDEWSVNSWTARDRYGTSCVQVDNFDWVIGIMPGPEEDDSLSDTMPDVYDRPDEFPVLRETAAVQSLCFPVVVQMRPQEGCDPVLPLPVYKGHKSLMVDDSDVIMSGRESTMRMSNLNRDICVEPDHLPVVVPKLAAVPLAAPVLAQTRPRVGRGPDLPLPMDEGRGSLHDDAVDIYFSGRESTMRMSNVSCDICVEPDHLPAVVPKLAAVPLAARWSLRRKHGLAGARICPCR